VVDTTSPVASSVSTRYTPQCDAVCVTLDDSVLILVSSLHSRERPAH
jgi:hypothetical protein